MPNRRELGYVSAGSTSTIPATTGYGVATGGSSSSNTVSLQNYTLLTFTSDSNLVVSTAGLFDVLLIGGGGAGGGSYTDTISGGGGGGGGVLGINSTTTIYLPAATYTVDVGAGGAGTTEIANGGIGLKSSIGSQISVAGGGGGGCWDGQLNIYPTGASGGGVIDASLSGTGSVSCDSNVGNNGGGATTSNGAGGGGGAGGVGGGSTGTTGGAGGNGKDISGFITGATYYAGAGGGGAGSVAGGAAGNGGVAGKTSGAGNNGVNYGAAGGGTVSASQSGNGAAGAVFVRFKV